MLYNWDIFQFWFNSRIRIKHDFPMLSFRKCQTVFCLPLMCFVLVFVASTNTWQNREYYCSTKLLKIEAYRKQWTMTVAWPANGSSSLFSLFFSHPLPGKTRRESEENIWGLIKHGQDRSDRTGADIPFAGNMRAAAVMLQGYSAGMLMQTRRR